MAPRAMPLLRRRHHVLGARRDGPDACRDRGDRRPGSVAVEAGGVGRRARARRGRAPLARASARVPAGARRTARRRPRGAVRRLADLLRADQRRGDGRDGVRGPAVGRRGSARLHRVDARMVAEQADLHRHAGASGARRPPAELGLGPAQLPGDAPGAAPRRDDGRARARDGARRRRRRRDPDRRASRGHAAVRRRDDPDARRPRRAAARRGLLRARGRPRRDPGPGDAARADRLAARRARAGGPRAAAGRRGPRARASRSMPSRPSTDADPASLEPRLLDFTRKEFLAFEADPRSPERGQYAFVQSIIREVAYGMLSKADRRTPAPGGGPPLRIRRRRRAGRRRGRALRRGARRHAAGSRRRRAGRPGAGLARAGRGTGDLARLPGSGARVRRAGARDHAAGRGARGALASRGTGRRRRPPARAAVRVPAGGDRGAARPRRPQRRGGRHRRPRPGPRRPQSVGRDQGRGAGAPGPAGGRR